MTGYRAVLALPGMAALLVVSLVARIALTAGVMALTLTVVLGLGRSYAAGGVVAAALTAGLAVGGPVVGRSIDGYGLRPVLAVTAGIQGVFWAAAPYLPYEVLLGAAFVAGVAMVPAPLVTRQVIAAVTRGEQRRVAFAVESVQGELSYLAGPSLVILLGATVSPTLVAWGVGAALVVGGAGVALLDPPVRGDDEAAAGVAARPARRTWLGPRMAAALIMAFGATTLLSGIDIAIVATLRDVGQLGWAAVVVAVSGASSVTGGLIYGARPRPLPTWSLLAALGVATLPAGLAHDWRWLCAAVVGAGLLTAPTLATVADAVAGLAPAAVRGEAAGLQSAANSAGVALGATAVGWAIDATTPAAGFVTAGAAGVAAALAGWALSRRAARGEAASSRGTPVAAARC